MQQNDELATQIQVKIRKTILTTKKYDQDTFSLRQQVILGQNELNQNTFIRITENVITSILNSDEETAYTKVITLKVFLPH